MGTGCIAPKSQAAGVELVFLEAAPLYCLDESVMATLHAYVGSAVENLALRRASSGAADIFGFFYYLTGHVSMPEWFACKP